MCHLPATLMRALTSISAENNQWWPQTQTQLTHNNKLTSSQIKLPRIPLQRGWNLAKLHHELGKSEVHWAGNFQLNPLQLAQLLPALPGWHSHTGWLFPAVFCFQFRSVSFPNPPHAEMKAEWFSCWVFYKGGFLWNSLFLEIISKEWKNSEHLKEPNFLFLQFPTA